MWNLRSRMNRINMDRVRIWVQFFAFLFLTYGAFLGVSMGQSVPTMTCIYAENRGGSCFLYPFQRYLSLPWPMLFGAVFKSFLVYVGVFLLWGLVLGKAFCGWFCPLGFLQDLLTRLRMFLGVDGSRFRWHTRDRFQWIKYALLALLILLPMGMGNSIFGLPALSSDFAVPFCQICPGKPLAPLFHGELEHFAINFSTPVKLVFTSLSMIILGLFLAGGFVKRRYICAFCPMAALLSLFDRIGFLNLRKKGDACTRCGNCFRACPLEIREIADLRDRKHIVTQDCMLCLRCVEVCPEEKALEATFLGIAFFSASPEGFLSRQAHLSLPPASRSASASLSSSGP